MDQSIACSAGEDSSILLWDNEAISDSLHEWQSSDAYATSNALSNTSNTSNITSTNTSNTSNMTSTN
eukprot:CAMPEP_0113851148 /NCGR_PEP_ID=MMETSP0372-20130328/4407_1 /TAXON_ID=340204 /ORGANISM="Lankesteria abbotti" /LENGTH=66 /DNA_ID=CAMNT_0000821781 /DNA_START=668 /DNA_END=865 /DNA_ORIENTATION=- /assembly_acc=CAM_ASM_000359